MVVLMVLGVATLVWIAVLVARAIRLDGLGQRPLAPADWAAGTTLELQRSTGVAR